jgi:hypothetical protein
MGRWLTKSLFIEQDHNADLGQALYTLADEDRQGVPSLYRLYIEMKDPSEYYFAKKYLGGWDHWERLTKSPWFKPYIESWRKELDVLIKAEALHEIIRIAQDSSHKSSYEANKILLREKPTAKRGRPTKDEVNKEATRIASEEDRVLKDAERILQ